MMNIPDMRLDDKHTLTNYHGVSLAIRSDGYVNAYYFCKHYKKNLDYWMKLKRNYQFVNKVSEETGLPVEQLIDNSKTIGSHSSYIFGVYVHPLIMPEIIRYCANSPVNEKQIDKPVNQMNNTITHKITFSEYKNVQVTVMDNGYMNVSQYCDHYKKSFHKWQESKTGNYILKMISKKLNLPISELIIENITGVYVHPEIMECISEICDELNTRFRRPSSGIDLTDMPLNSD